MPESAARPWLKHYDYWVRPTMNYPRRSLYEILRTTAVEIPDAIATVFLGATLTFSEIKRQADCLAAALHKLGVFTGGANRAASGCLFPTPTSKSLIWKRAKPQSNRARKANCASTRRR